MAILRAINTGVSFLLELAMLVALGYWGFRTPESLWLKWALGIGVPLLVAILWGLFLAPKAGQRMGSTLGVTVSLCLFYLAALALFQTKHPALGTAMVVLAAINRTLVVVWKQW